MHWVSQALVDLWSHPKTLGANIVMFTLSYDSLLPLGICIWIAGYLEFALPNDLEHQCNRV
jgi:hypothetical protein